MQNYPKLLRVRIQHIKFKIQHLLKAESKL